MTTGIATKKSESGSGGERNAPSKNAANQMCLRYERTVERPTISILKTSKVTSGAWNPMADAIAKIRNEPDVTGKPPFCRLNLQSGHPLSDIQGALG